LAQEGIAALTPQQALIVRLRVSHLELSQRKIAVMLELSEPAVSRTLDRARTRLVALGVMGRNDDWEDVAEMLRGLLR
jgi:predicted transcriptional regulator